MITLFSDQHALHAPAFEGLQENAAAVAEDAGDAHGRVVAARLRKNGFGEIAGAGVDRAAGVKKAYQHM